MPTFGHIGLFSSYALQENIQAHTTRVDEDGALANSSEFTQFFLIHYLTLDTTGSYNSWLNGMVECSNGTIANKARASLLNAGHKADKWCFAVEAAADIYHLTRHSALQNLHMKPGII
jgi:hypothetical protein